MVGSRRIQMDVFGDERRIRNYFAEEITLLQSYASKGAYEWLVSLGEIDRWRRAWAIGCWRSPMTD